MELMVEEDLTWSIGEYALEYGKTRPKAQEELEQLVNMELVKQDIITGRYGFDKEEFISKLKAGDFDTPGKEIILKIWVIKDLIFESLKEGLDGVPAHEPH